MLNYHPPTVHLFLPALSTTASFQDLKADFVQPFEQIFEHLYQLPEIQSGDNPVSGFAVLGLPVEGDTLPASTPIYKAHKGFPFVVKVVLPLPLLLNSREELRAKLFPHVHPILGRLYSLLEAAAAKAGWDIHPESAHRPDFSGQGYLPVLDWDSVGATKNSIDIQILFAPGQDPSNPIKTNRWPHCHDTIIDLERHWKNAKTSRMVYQVKFPADMDLLDKTVPDGVDVQVFPSSSVARCRDSNVYNESLQTLTAGQPDQQTPENNTKKFKPIVGGTFDHLHSGHKILLTMTAFSVDYAEEYDPPIHTWESDDSDEMVIDNLGRNVTIGIMTDENLTKKKHSRFMQQWIMRAFQVLAFLESISDAELDSATDCMHSDTGHIHSLYYVKSESYGLSFYADEIYDGYGPTVETEDLSVLVLSGETREGGKAVNDYRVDKLNWHPLEIREISVLDSSPETADGEPDPTFATKVSSSTIRQLKSDTYSPLSGPYEERLEELREEFRRRAKPFRRF